MKVPTLIGFAAAVEAVVGIVLVVDPSLVASLLMGAPLAALGTAIGRVAGFALFGLGLACRPGPNAAGSGSAAHGLFAYNALAAALFLYLGVRGELVGLLLWPAAALHGVLAVLLARVLVAGSGTAPP